jgi:D-3-phosphoglycerate dehydrogenase
MRAMFVDADATLAAVAERLRRLDDPEVIVHIRPNLQSEDLPETLAGATVAIVDHTAVPIEIARRCNGLQHIVFLGTGARSYMDPEALAGLGIQVHTIKGYGDTAVAECAIALMWAAARGLARMDREVRAGRWLGLDGMQLTGKTLGLIGFGGVAAEVARIAHSSGLRVLAWNRTPKSLPAQAAPAVVEFTGLDRLLAESHVVSIHLLLAEETRGFLSAERIGRMRPGAILVNTARGAIVDEAAMVAALADGRLAHAGLDVFSAEPLPPDHPLTTLPNVTLSAHSAFRTPEATDNLVAAALDYCRGFATARPPA